MKTSDDRILTTHTGSLPRPEALLSLVLGREEGQPVEPNVLAKQVREAVHDVVERQSKAGVDVVSDGEMSKAGYSNYVKDRLSGFAGEGQMPQPGDLLEFPSFAQHVFQDRGLRALKTPECRGPVSYRDRSWLEADIANFSAAVEATRPVEAFLTAASPGVISLFLKNQHYASHEAYVYALADAMKVEYEAIHQAGFILQVDAPDLAMGRHTLFADQSLKAFLDRASLHVEALNRALANIPPDRVRIHLCWGNYEGPHHRDVALQDIVEVVLKARVAGISFTAANPRHEHEWRVWDKLRLPDDKILIPGVIDTTSNVIEHCELVADRIVRFAELVGRERVIAGTDCGFSTFAGLGVLDPAVSWAKLEALAEGARLASHRLVRPSSRLKSASHRLARRIRPSA